LSDWDSDAKVPKFSGSVLDTFVPTQSKPDAFLAKNLRSVEQVEKAMDTMFDFRAEVGLEDRLFTIAGWPEYQPVPSCSESTNAFYVTLYQRYVLAYIAPGSYIKWIEQGDFLTRTVEWL